MSKRKRRKQAPLQADSYKATWRPVETPPKSWRDVLGKINRSLMLTVTNLLGIIPDALDSIRKVVRAVPRSFPRLLSILVGRAHHEADAVESQRQEEVAAGTGEMPNPEQVAETLAEVLQRMQAQGIHVNVSVVDGRMVVVAVRPELAEAAEKVGQLAAEGINHEDAISNAINQKLQIEIQKGYDIVVVSGDGGGSFGGGATIVSGVPKPWSE